MLFLSFPSVNKQKYLRQFTNELKYYKKSNVALITHATWIFRPFKNLLINFNKKKKTELKIIKYINLDLIHFEQKHIKTLSQI